MSDVHRMPDFEDVATRATVMSDSSQWARLLYPRIAQRIANKQLTRTELRGHIYEAIAVVQESDEPLVTTPDDSQVTALVDALAPETAGEFSVPKIKLPADFFDYKFMPHGDYPDYSKPLGTHYGDPHRYITNPYEEILPEPDYGGLIIEPLDSTWGFPPKPDGKLFSRFLEVLKPEPLVKPTKDKEQDSEQEEPPQQ